MKILFDLDSTVTACETLPFIASHFGIREDMEATTLNAVRGKSDFEESFRQRVAILGKLDVGEVADVVTTVPLHDSLADFIKTHADICAIATSNLDCWCAKLAGKLGCRFHSSKAILSGNRITEISEILDKKEIVCRYQDQEEYVAFCGDGHNDLKAMQASDYAIEVAITHSPIRALTDCARLTVHSEKELTDALNSLLAGKVII